MKGIKNMSIRWKLVLMIMAGSFITLLLGLALNLYFEAAKYKSGVMNSYLTHASIIAEWIASPLHHKKVDEIYDIMSRYEKLQKISSIKVYDKANRYVTGYFKEYPDTLHNIIHVSSFQSYQHGVAHIHVPIYYQGGQTGTLCFMARSDHLKKVLISTLRMGLIFLFPVLIVVTLMALWMQRYISSPLIKLASVTQKVARENDYSFTIEKNSSDEIGTLYDAFNHLLKQVLHHGEEMKETNLKLQVEKQKAIQSDQLKSAFLGNMSHEIRTPMNAIIGFTQLFQRNDLSLEKRKQYIDFIKKSSESLTKVIDDIIDMSRIEAGELSLIKKQFRLVPLLEKIEATINVELMMADKKHIQNILSYDKQCSDLIIDNDSHRLRQVLINLLLNAVKFTEKGSINFGFNIFNENEIIFFVKDTGIGIEKNQKNDIFERFVKSESDGIKKTYRGAGLGLAIAKNLVNLMNGRIWYESEPGQGTAFYFTAPFAVTILNTNYIEHRDKATKDFNSMNDWSGKTILVAEDEESNFLLIHEILCPTNVKIVHARNGKEAIEIYKKQKTVDVVLMDIKMPLMDGFEASEAIKEVNPAQVIIAQTAFALKDERERLMNAGFDNYIAKPIMPDDLMQLVAKYLT